LTTRPVGEQRIPVDRGPVGGQHEGAAGGGAGADQFVEVVGLGGGELAHAEVVADQHGGPDEFGEAAVPGAVGVPAGQGGQQPAGLGEPDVGAVTDGQVAEGLGDVGLADPDGPVEDHALAGGEPAQRGQIADLRGGQLRGGGEVEPLEGGLGLELGAAQPAGDGLGLAPGDLVVAEDLQELDVAEFPGAGLSQAGVEGLEHPGQLQRP
jgi:hypothetical protein